MNSKKVQNSMQTLENTRMMYFLKNMVYNRCMYVYRTSGSHLGDSFGKLGIGYGLEVHVQSYTHVKTFKLHAGPRPTVLLLGLNTVKYLSLLMLFLLEVQCMHDACSPTLSTECHTS